MSSSRTQAVQSKPPKQRSIYLITYSQCGNSGLSRQAFAQIILDAWNDSCLSRIIQWVVSEEMHQDGGKHFHMALKLDKKTRWLAVRNFLDMRHGIKVNFSDKHDNYFSAYKYVVKDDADYVLSDNHPDLTNATAPRTTNASQKRKGTAKKAGAATKKKKKRMAVYDVVRIIQTKGIKSRLELMALASKWQEQGKTDLAEFVSNRGPRVVNEALETAHELTMAEKRLERINKTRIQLLQEHLTQPCRDNCEGIWLRSAAEILEGNGIPVSIFAGAVYDALLRGRGKYRNIYIYGPANCGKTFLISPLKTIYECFVNPASGSFAWVGVDQAEVWHNYKRTNTTIDYIDLLEATIPGGCFVFSHEESVLERDKFCVGDSFYHELSMLHQGLPRSYLIKQCGDDLNAMCHIDRHPGSSQGAKVHSIREVIVEHVKEYLAKLENFD
ncbi:hypothetical protein BSL78_20361 [Paramuricea clavata]|uniref:CRESS-DNA virus Rep endonuclease domain-containing protein n=1 Tax=Paramuricea clavata TaxID=317549 RepID=A0A7D9E3P8_PARCT|nr:hypothetical protein BSL78_20361 [Paramuricea clavata]